MGSVIHDDSDDPIVLGDAIDVLRAWGEWAKVAVAAGDGDRWEHLASLPDNLEQTPGAAGIEAVQAEARAFLRSIRGRPERPRRARPAGPHRRPAAR